DVRRLRVLLAQRPPRIGDPSVHPAVPDPAHHDGRGTGDVRGAGDRDGSGRSARLLRRGTTGPAPASHSRGPDRTAGPIADHDGDPCRGRDGKRGDRLARDDVGMQLHDVVDTSAELAATRSRNAKTAALSRLLGGAPADELSAAVAFLTGRPTQGRIGVGWRTLTQLRPAPAPSASLTVAEVDRTLGEIASTSGSGSTSRRTRLLHDLLARATTEEQDFLLRLPPGELRQGALEGVMIEAIAAATEAPADLVRRAVMLSGDLAVTASAAASGGTDALERFRLEVGRPVRPMLASPAESLDDAVTRLGEPIVEYKMDGARIQVHRDGDEVRVYTRTLREITRSVGELADLVRSLPCERVVLDGETLALTDDGRPRPFQETMGRFGSTADEQVRELLLRPYFFDCLHVDGNDLLDAPLRERRAALHEVAGEHVIPGEVAPDDPATLLDAALAAGHEGVMVKDPDSPYAAGRRGRAWLKVKPSHTLD